MSLINYRITVQTASGQEKLDGMAELSEGPLRIRCDVPEGHLRDVEADMRLEIAEDDRIFVNGYQTWTHSPEFAPGDVQRVFGKKLPKKLTHKFYLERYGDIFFRNYPQTPGIFTGYSYCYIRNGEEFRLFASLDEEPGYTVFTVDAASGKLLIERDCRGMSCKGELKAFDIFYAKGSEDEVFDAWFDAMGIKARTTEKLAGYTSWYNRYNKISESELLSDLDGAAGVLKHGDLFQIDDGWQAAVGDWLTVREDRFPSGLKAFTDEIHLRGYKAGLWLAPFGAQESSELVKNHPDWLLKPGGKPWVAGVNWGPFYALDIDKPEVAAYLEKVFRTVFDEWGFDLVKLDFLYAAAPYGTEDESRAGRMIRAMKLIRSWCGDKLVLGCGVPLMPAFGLVDYCRIGCDVGPEWDSTALMRMTHRERVSTKNSIDDTTFRRQLNGRAFMNDPDVFFLRDENCKMNAEEKKALYTANASYGGILLTSDDFSKWDDEKKAVYKEIRSMFGG
ncbi:MAG: alpha-galactosidase [Firmicutes bacterium]|nr:alpha-galactosidase [Bacillota bacterium]MBR6236423.1 alpha-galactosidase [Bacillota bacterium]